MTQPNLRDMMVTATGACGLAAEQRPRFAAEPINWADLRCISAEAVIDQDGDCTLRVVISEAGPGCPKLAEYIRGQLADTGYPKVDVVMEW